MPRALNAVQRSIREAEKSTRVAQTRKAPHTNTMAQAMQVSEDKPLTELQRSFARHIAEGNSIPNAMQLAGYNEQPSYGYRMVKMPNIKREIAKYQAQYQEAAHLKKQDVMDMLKEAYEMSKLMAEPATMVSAAREIGKLCGFYEPTKVQVDVNMTGSVKFQQLTDAELFAMIEKAAVDGMDTEPEALEGPETP